MLVPPESNEIVDEVLRWFYKTIPARKHDFMVGMPHKLSWDDVKSLIGYEPSLLPIRDLAMLAFEADGEYLKFLSKNKEESK